MPDYRIIESVGTGEQPVTNWADIEHHHPSKDLQEAGRVYARIDGHAEEVAGDYGGTAIYTPGGQLMVSKDLILLNAETGSANVPVPSPANGFIGEVDRRNGFVTILERPGGEVMFRLRHMDIDDNIQPGTEVKYGQFLGNQAGYGRGDPNYFGTHLHIDANVRYLDQADRYVRDMASGVIAIYDRPDDTPNIVNEVPPIEQIRGTFPAPPVQALADGRIQQGEQGPDVALLQEKLRAAGARDAQGREIVQDGDFGNATREAVEHYQRMQEGEVPVTGVADRETLSRLGVIEAQERTLTTPASENPASDGQEPQGRTRAGAGLLDRIREAVNEEATLGMGDVGRERLSASLFANAVAMGFTDRDELTVAFNRPTDQLAEGELVQLFRQGNGASPDPAANRVSLRTQEALSTPVEESVARAEAATRTQAETQQVGQHQEMQRLEAEQAMRI